MTTNSVIDERWGQRLEKDKVEIRYGGDKLENDKVKKVIDSGCCHRQYYRITTHQSHSGEVPLGAGGEVVPEAGVEVT